MNDEQYMLRCLELASNGRNAVAPNPMVGAVVVHDGKIIGEGWHKKYGEAHAEVNAIHAVTNQSLLKKSTLYVNLEPCNHFGKTPPCSDLIVAMGIPKVVIGCRDSNPTVNGGGIDKLRAAGVEVIVGVLEAASKELNAAFFFSNQYKRPYVILKWAQSKNGTMGDLSHPNLAISNEASQQLVHRWRSESAAILVGTSTAAIDNPSLTVRNYSGPNPICVVIDLDLKLDLHLKIFNGTTPTLVFTRKQKNNAAHITYISLPGDENILDQVLHELHARKIQTLFVEGGSKLLQSFINKGLWNEARIFTSDKSVEGNVKSPQIRGKKIAESHLKNDTLVILLNEKTE